MKPTTVLPGRLVPLALARGALALLPVTSPAQIAVSGNSTEATQSQKYQELFPVMWTHASVKGITLWGCVEDQTWKAGTGPLNSNGTERAAMTWLKSHVASH